MAVVLGVDTGGTYTDAVLLDDAAGRVLASAKALTSRPDLSHGIGGAILPFGGGLEPVPPERAARRADQDQRAGLGWAEIGVGGGDGQRHQPLLLKRRERLRRPCHGARRGAGWRGSSSPRRVR